MNITERLNQAVALNSAMVAINVPSFDAMVGISRAAAERKSPAIIQVSARTVKQHGAAAVRAWFDAAKRIHPSDCFLHLDHCVDDLVLRDCILEGWDMVMFDGSGLPIRENCAKSKEISDFAHANNTAVEGEVGAIGGEEDGHEASANYARAEDISALAEIGGVDCIAVGFGNVHGDYATKTNLRWDIFESARELSGLPLVLHGGTGLTKEEFIRAINAGAAKVNISTELKKSYSRAISDCDLIARIPRDPSALHTRLIDESYLVALKYMALLGTVKEG